MYIFMDVKINIFLLEMSLYYLKVLIIKVIVDMIYFIVVVVVMEMFGLVY